MPDPADHVRGHARGSCRSGRRRSRAAWPAAAASGVSSAAAVTLGGDLVDQRQLVDEPRVDPRWPSKISSGVAPARIASITTLEPAVVRRPDLLEQRGLVEVRPTPGASRTTASLLLQGAQRLLQRLGEVAADRHRLADRLHVRGQRGVGGRELLEGEPRHLHHDVVERRLEGRRRLLGDVVGDLVEGVADRRPWRRSWRSGSRSPWRPARWSGRPAGSSRSRSSGRRPGRPRTGCCSRRCPRRPRG